MGEAWSKAVIAATLMTLVGLPLLAGVPLLGAGGALYRAMGVLTAGSPCAVVLVPLVSVGRCGEVGLVLPYFFITLFWYLLKGVELPPRGSFFGFMSPQFHSTPGKESDAYRWKALDISFRSPLVAFLPRRGVTPTPHFPHFPHGSVAAYVKI